MKKTLAALMTLGLIGTMGIGNAWAGRIAQRQEIQRHRIVQGVKSGELTRAETRRLIKTQRSIRRVKARSWADGHLTRSERLRIEHRQNLASRQIFRLKHNARDRHQP